MSSATPAGPAAGPGPADLAARVFRALYRGFDLHTAGDIHIAVPHGTACFAARSLGEVARQIAGHEPPPPPPRAPAGPA
jgi:hypothetical protein